MIFALNDTTTIEAKLVDDDQVGNASNGIPAPFWSFLNRESSEETSQDHDDIGNDGHKDVGTRKTSQEAKIEEQEWGGETPVDIAGPVDFTVGDRLDVRAMGPRDGLNNLILANPITDCHGIIRDHGKGGDESSQDMEHAFCLVPREVGVSGISSREGYSCFRLRILALNIDLNANGSGKG